MERYENLSGGEGREVFFRAPRLTENELFGSELVAVRLDGRRVRLRDISLTGMSADMELDDDEAPPEPGQPLALEIRLDGQELFSCRTEVARVEAAPGACMVAVRYQGACPDFTEFARLDGEATLLAALERSPKTTADLVPAAYKALCADVLHLFSELSHLMREFDGGNAAETRVTEAAYQAGERWMLDAWRELWQRGEDIVRDIPQRSPEFDAIKAYTERVLTPAFMGGDIWRRSYEKPRGYPGDYGIMKMVYAWARQGGSVEGRLIHRIGLDVAECIATRMLLVQRAIAQTIGKFGADGVARIASLGCGPAKEVENVLASSRLAGQAHFTLIDQDMEALVDTNARLTPAVARLSEQASLTVLHETFTQLLRGSIVSEGLERQHLVYSVGLIDYLAEGTAQRLLKTLYDRLEPGGLMMIGNMADSDLSNYWPMEFIADWRVKYRSRDEMVRLAARCEGADLEVVPESTRRVWMLYVRKPA
jgi:hypothetical protein